MPKKADLSGELFAALQRLLPQHTLSRLIASLAQAETPWLKNLLIKQFIRTYNINLDEPASSDPDDYASFNAFFTRALKPEARPVAENSTAIVSPADGFVSQLGRISDDQVIQAKGMLYSASQLLGEASSNVGNFANGEFATIYLSPRDYHRVHAPIGGKLLFSRYIPGKLFSVNDATTAHINNLFTRNERLVTLFDTDAGKCALVMVGAMLVAGISTVWHGRYQPGTAREVDHSTDDVRLAKGDELGQFYFGSTVVLLFEQRKTRLLNPELSASQVMMGQVIGAIASTPSR